MGNTKSAFFERVSVDPWWSNEQILNSEEVNQTINANEFKMEANVEISTLHEKRIKLIAEKKKEFDDLRREVFNQQKENEELKRALEEATSGRIVQKCDISQQTDTFEVPGQPERYDLKSKVEELQQELSNIEIVKNKNRDLQINIAELQKELQSLNSEFAAFENERHEYKTHVIALKDIITVSKQLLLMREGQIKELTQKVAEIQASLAEKELTTLSEDLREEYERQLRNIKQLKQLYEERQRADKTERDSLKNQLEEATAGLKTQESQTSELQSRVDELEKDNSDKSGSVITLESQLGFSKAECAELRAEMSIINQLFSQILLGFNNGQEINLDKLIRILEENHDLLTDIVVNEECTQISSALPKVLLDLVNQVNERAAKNETSVPQEPEPALLETPEEPEPQTSGQQNSLSSPSEIVENLPKVWRVLTELLSHQAAPISVLSENDEQSDKNPCYKSVQTPSGPTLVLSVSKTFIRLKNLILEKKSLEKETTRLKQLNTHLETRLQDQEKRLETVSHELSKTWHVVGKMQKQHQQLHTQEKILRYELAQKRKLLNELKEELEYCREKWLQAREKNSTTEEQWKQLRTEFASRKNTISEDLNNSVESGYSDERESSSDDDEIVDLESDLSVASPGCSNISENLKAADVPEEEDKDPKVALNMLDQESESIQTSQPSEAVDDKTILNVIRDEISKIEGTDDCVGDTSSTPQQLQDVACCTTNTIAEEPEAEPSVSKTTEDNECSTSAVSNTEVENCTDELPNINSQTTSELTIALNGNGTSSTPQQLQDVACCTTNTTDEELESEPSVSKITEDNECSTSAVSKTEVENCTDELPSINSQTTSKLTIALGNENIDEVHSMETVKTDLVQNGDQVQKASDKQLSEWQQAQSTETEQSQKQCESNENSRRQDINNMYKKLEEDILQTIKKIQTGDESYASSSNQNRTTEEIFMTREERLRNLEEQSTQLINRATKTSHKSNEINSKLDSLHEQYGESSKQTKQDTEVEVDVCHNQEQDISTNIEEAQNVESSKQNTSTEEMLKAREERLTRLEAQSNDLVNKASNTTRKSKEIDSKLDELHQRYGECSKQNTEQEVKTDLDVTHLEGNCSSSDEASSSRNPEEMLARREERLQRMEEEARELMGKAIRNSARGFQFCTKLNKLHDRYGTSSDSSDEGADDNNNMAVSGEPERGEEHNPVPEGNTDNTNSNQEDSKAEEHQ